MANQLTNDSEYGTEQAQPVLTEPTVTAPSSQPEPMHTEPSPQPQFSTNIEFMISSSRLKPENEELVRRSIKLLQDSREIGVEFLIDSRWNATPHTPASELDERLASRLVNHFCEAERRHAQLAKEAGQ